MKKWILAAGVCSLIITACDKEDNNDELNNTDRDFVVMASISNNAEIGAGQLAATKGSNAKVKAYGQQMVSEHTMAQSDLRTRATNVGITVSDTVDAVHRALMTKLASLSGYAFDTTYMGSQVRDHQNTLNLFNTEISSGQHTQIRTYATDYQPHIQMHFNTADSIRRAL
jgi:putative membrane protein